jgi:hypothetical protein
MTKGRKEMITLAVICIAIVFLFGLVIFMWPEGATP